MPIEKLRAIEVDPWGPWLLSVPVQNILSPSEHKLKKKKGRLCQEDNVRCWQCDAGEGMDEGLRW